jgi:hypothetical protein
MVDIFIPILWVCINAKCEFMQEQWYSTNEQECAEEVRVQKRRIRSLAEEAGGKVDVLEGTCIDARVKNGMSMKFDMSRGF